MLPHCECMLGHSCTAAPPWTPLLGAPSWQPLLHQPALESCQDEFVPVAPVLELGRELVLARELVLEMTHPQLAMTVSMNLLSRQKPLCKRCY